MPQCIIQPVSLLSSVLDHPVCCRREKNDEHEGEERSGLPRDLCRILFHISYPC